MTAVQLITALEKFSIDVLCLGFLVCGVTSIVKKFVPTKAKKFLTFVPFIIGTLVYIAFRYFAYGETDLFSAANIQSGVECGSISTIYYVIFEQFLRGKRKFPNTDNPLVLAVAGELQHVVHEKYLTDLPKYIVDGVSNTLTDNGYSVSFCVEALRGKTLPGITETDLINISKVIISSLTVLAKKNSK